MEIKKVNQKIIGFAAETENVLENANKKLVKKNADYIIANDVSKKMQGFNVDTNIITVIGKNKQKEYPILSKNEVANIILDLLVK